MSEKSPNTGNAQAPRPVMIPAICRKVHYVLPKDSPRVGQHRSAEITGVSADGNPDALLNLTVFLDQRDDLPEASTFHPLCRAWSAPHDEETKAPGTWHWPEKV